MRWWSNLKCAVSRKADALRAEGRIKSAFLVRHWLSLIGATLVLTLFAYRAANAATGLELLVVGLAALFFVMKLVVDIAENDPDRP